MCQRQSCHERNFERTCDGSASKVDSTKKRDKTTARKNTATGKRKLVGADAAVKRKRKKKKEKVKPEPLPSDEDISLSEVVGKRKRSTNNAEVIKIEPKQKRARTGTKKKSAVAKNIVPKVTNYTSVNFAQKDTKQIGLGNFFTKKK